MPLTSITKIPGIMRHPNQNWPKAATLMEKWFSRPASIAPNYTAADTSTITMDWVLGFARARTVYDALILDRVWVNQPARAEIEKLMRRKGFLVEAQNSFNELGLAVDRVDVDHIQHRPVPYDGRTPVDDSTAALGRFSFRILVAGSISPTAPPHIDGHEVVIKEIGVYVRDSYDFEGAQPLGCWNEVTNSVKLDAAPGWEPVSNETFRNHRSANGRGGDFLVFSNIKRVSLTVPDKFIIPRRP